MTNVQAPQRNLIVAKLEGDQLTDTSVLTGMSGRPVYVDGRLVGAVSYSIGSFSKEPIAGITPIGEVIDATSTSSARRATGQVSARIPLPITPEGLAAAVKNAYTQVAAFAD